MSQDASILSPVFYEVGAEQLSWPTDAICLLPTSTSPPPTPTQSPLCEEETDPIKKALLDFASNPLPLPVLSPRSYFQSTHPQPLPSLSATLELEGHHVFLFSDNATAARHHEFSNAFRTSFFHKDKKFTTAHQCLLFEKATFMGFPAVAHQTLGVYSENALSKLSKLVENESLEASWTRQLQYTLLSVLQSKFEQNIPLRNKLLRTGENVIAFASVDDLYFGTGVSISDPNAHMISIWTGQSFLGQTLMFVREMIKVKMKEASSKLIESYQDSSIPSLKSSLTYQRRKRQQTEETQRNKVKKQVTFALDAEQKPALPSPVPLPPPPPVSTSSLIPIVVAVPLTILTNFDVPVKCKKNTRKRKPVVEEVEVIEISSDDDDGDE